MKYKSFLFDADAGQGGGGQQNLPPVTPPAGDPPAGQPGPVPYERFKQVNDELKTVKDQLTAIQTAEQQRKDKEAAEQGKWKELAEKNEADLKKERLENTRLKVATKKGIPADLIDRLQGNTEEELAADADKLLAFLKPATGPGVPPAGKGGSQKPLDITKMTPKQIREKAGEIWEQQVKS